jgi:hypothetical protein
MIQSACVPFDPAETAVKGCPIVATKASQGEAPTLRTFDGKG